ARRCTSCSSIKPTSPRRARSWASTRPQRPRRGARNESVQWSKLDYALSRAAGGERVTATADATMLDVLQGFVHELPLARLPVSVTENLDAMPPVGHLPL